MRRRILLRHDVRRSLRRVQRRRQTRNVLARRCRLHAVGRPRFVRAGFGFDVHAQRRLRRCGSVRAVQLRDDLRRVDVQQWDVYAEVRLRRQGRVQNTRFDRMRAVRLSGRDHVLLDVQQQLAVLVA